jgi:hypothetical protein
METSVSAAAPLRRRPYLPAALVVLGCIASYGLSRVGSAALAVDARSAAAAAPGSAADNAASRSTVPSRANARRAELRAGLTQLLGDIESDLRTSFADDRLRQRYDDCVSSGGQCDGLRQELTSNAIAAVDERRSFREGIGLARWVQHSGGQAVALVLGQIIAASSSEFERIAALLVLASDPSLPEQDRIYPLPPGAYRDLARRSPNEIMMIARREHGATGLSTESAREFVPLVRSPLSPVRRAVLTVLGHREHAAALHEALGLGTLERRDLFAAAMAISNCGLPCSESLELLLQTGTREARVALYEAIAFAPDEDRQQLIARLRVASIDVPGEERELRDDLLREALGDEETQ